MYASLCVANSLVSVGPPHDGATAKPDRLRKPSANCPSLLPKPVGKSSPPITDKSPILTDSSAVIYSQPFGRPAVVTKKPAAATETSNASELSPAARSSTGVDARGFHEYSEIFPARSMPALSPTSPIYAEVDKPKTPTGGNSKPLSPSYEYADPDAMGKWSLQHIARGQRQPVECEYAFIPVDDEGAYSAVEMPTG